MVKWRDSVLNLGALLRVVVYPGKMFLIAFFVLITAGHQKVLNRVGS